jgi:hypothetical protein
MSGPFEEFVQENRDEFDHESPDPEIWEKVRKRMNPEKEKPGVIRAITFKRWMMAAAAVLVFAVIAGIVIFSKYEKAPSNVSKIKPAEPFPENKSPDVTKTTDTPTITPKSETADSNKIREQETASTPVAADSKEMYYYSKLIEIKQEELKTLEKDEPLLYKQFSGDVEKLDKVYHSLKKQLPENSNPEQVMEAMISNLQLQMNLLNRQLKIIKQIKHSKKAAYENAYKSI